jgi:hypothetical protein
MPSSAATAIFRDAGGLTPRFPIASKNHPPDASL